MIPALTALSVMVTHAALLQTPSYKVTSSALTSLRCRIPVEGIEAGPSPFRANNIPLAEIVVNSDDPEDEAINRTKLALAEGLKQAVLDAEVREWLLTNLRSLPDGRHFVHFQEMLEAFPGRSMAVEGAMRRASHGDLSFVNLVNTLVHTGIQYYPVINIPNLEVADVTGSPLVSPGIEIEDIPEMGIEDDLLAWESTELGWRAIRIAEGEALSTSRPLFVVSLDDSVAGHQYQILAPLVLPSTPGSPGAATITQFHGFEYQINHRYDKSANSEFSINVIRVDSNLNGVGRWAQIADVHKKKVGKQLQGWHYFCDNNLPYADHFVFFNTYERDWYASDKSLGTVTVTTASGSVSFGMSGRRTYTSEWYMFDPNSAFNNTTNRVDLNYIFWTWAYWYKNDKGNYRIWRVQI